ncbi:MAG: glutamine--fructose-6-phosphate transaminase (isomerizing) [Saprospiraceae bacterium]|jgi:glutamine---fructose-6-phosphate transaminase (isomerizing)|uniref:Glutamine--fructose-6-phosphate aminotransferase [isomerizing] n=1 Tax=Candidatus Defluviibacterium haderslevense TaxID=2981993 RepID=A0A9D7S5H5_9BACT|nr:glutamine--fructose-6-phosphate transaminase (isomerizing) [Candidatus Defluviibacterium haderslevense]MBK9716222.1 glutamine--fructose-6-phosphate transaminase (isomerizing) [Candidatus Defluviibacterium haderslevense]MCC7025711.1 glutamine--fructose-6-phosphate transaminase (isomerizing) [Saprospiraceae bacterium]MCI1267776.1 glutamine--fructose-6-phosphate transaminase (isomerizing) [Saprospiraceae bacterium]
MCGIVAYIGNKNAYPILIEGLQRLEYRGYDSAGIALMTNKIDVFKKKGKVQELVDFTEQKHLSAHVGMGHTRWATHGKPDDINAHPHYSGSERLAIIHNGIIENYATIAEALIRLGHQFISETDTEILVHLIEEVQQREQLTLVEAVRKALSRVIGAYAIVVMDREQPDVIVGARKSSPLVVGIGDDEYFIASDATPIIQYTNKVIYLNDEEIVEISLKNGVEITTISNEIQEPIIHELDMSLDQLEKSGFAHFMMKEIYQQPQTISDCMRGRLNDVEGWVRLGGLEEHSNRIANAKRIIIAACGTSWHSALIGEYIIEELARIPVEVEYASEFRYRNPILGPQDVVLVISQSGETADTRAAAELAKERGALVYGIVNVVGSSIARLTDAGSYIHCGPEIGVASTKAFTGQVTLLSLMAMVLGHKNGSLSNSYYHQLIAELAKIPSKVEQVLATNEQITFLAGEIKHTNNALYLGRGYNFPVALEGALKLKEISYIHAEGYPAAEMKHGPIALIDENMPVIVIATNKSAYEKIASNVQEVKARKGMVIAIVAEGDQEIKKVADYCIEIPNTIEPLTPLLSVIPLQLLSYHIAVMRNCDVDQPRNLAKSVTVE